MRTFLAELEERLQALDRDLLALESVPDAARRSELFTALFRTAHSLKGAAGSVGLELIEGACHRLEDIFAAARDGRGALKPESFELLFASADAMREAGAELRDGHDLANSRLALLLPVLEAAADSTTPGSVPERSAPAVPVGSAPAAATAARGDEVIRVAADKLDALLTQSSELLVAQRRTHARRADAARLQDLVRQIRLDWRIRQKALAKLARQDGGTAAASPPLNGGDRSAASGRAALSLQSTGENLKLLERELDRLSMALAADSSVLEQAASSLNGEVSRVRMLPFAEACGALDRIARDIAKSSGKDVRLVVTGGDVEIDRAIIDGLKDPLIHLVRNAIDHGIEPTNARRGDEKPAEGRVTVSAALRGASVMVTVEDDGAGLDMAAIRDKAVRGGLPGGDQGEVARYIFLPGFSTMAEATEVSGRGVGLDAVKAKIEAMRGTVDVASERGRGTRFALTLPLTLVTIRGLLVTLGGQPFVIDSASVVRLVRIAAGDLRSVEGRDVLLLGERPVPAVPLADILGLPPVGPRAGGEKLTIVLLAAGGRSAGFVVDEAVGEQEIVVRSLGRRLKRAKNIGAATILPTGRIALVLHSPDLLDGALSGAFRQRPAPEVAQAARSRVLLADDSLTTRTLEKSILEAAGYEVTAAADGLEAWNALRQHGADLVVSDVEMPRMDGFALVEAMRGSPRFRETPVVLVTARESEQDKARGLAVGADAYLVKSAFDQQKLLDAVAQLL